jgi:hypothetical protein
MITWRSELCFECDFAEIDYNPNCEQTLILDQCDAPTKKGMFAVAKHCGWTWNGNKCFCKSCSEKI